MCVWGGKEGTKGKERGEVERDGRVNWSTNAFQLSVTDIPHLVATDP